MSEEKKKNLKSFLGKLLVAVLLVGISLATYKVNLSQLLHDFVMRFFDAALNSDEVEDEDLQENSEDEKTNEKKEEKEETEETEDLEGNSYNFPIKFSDGTLVSLHNVYTLISESKFA